MRNRRRRIEQLEAEADGENPSVRLVFFDVPGEAETLVLTSETEEVSGHRQALVRPLRDDDDLASAKVYSGVDPRKI